MRKVRVTASMRKALAGLKRERPAVMIVPRMLGEEWEHHAIPAQARLIAEARDDPNATLYGGRDDNHSAASLDDVTDRYKPSAPPPAPDPTPLETKVQDSREDYEKRAARAYARHLGIYR